MLSKAEGLLETQGGKWIQLRYLDNKDVFLCARHDDRSHRTSPRPVVRRTLLKYMTPATMESPKPA